MVINLYKEMLNAFTKYKITERAIVFVKNSEGFIPVARFIDMAKVCNYENKQGTVRIDPSLKVVGRSFWLSRGSKNGYDGWIMHKKPILPTLESKVNNLFGLSSKIIETNEDNVIIYTGEE